MMEVVRENFMIILFSNLTQKSKDVFFVMEKRYYLFLAKVLNMLIFKFLELYD